jgi:hypothetical protein
MEPTHFLFVLAMLTGTIGAAPVFAAEAKAPVSVERAAEEPAAPSQKEPAKETDSIEPYSADQRDVGVAKAKTSLDELDLRIEELEKHVTDNSRKAIKDLKEERAEVAKSFDNLKKATRETWDTVKKDFIKSYEALKEKFKKTEAAEKSADPDKK